MNEIIARTEKERSTKKGKIVFLALFIVLSFLANSWFGPFHPWFEQPVIYSALYALLGILGFMWVLQFKLNFRIISLIFPHLALIIFTQMLFVQTFFQSSFGRIYEMILMFVVMIFIFLITYLTFLTCNIFAVSSFRKVPLEAVAKTSIYFISVMSVFFMTYALLSLEINFLTLIILLLLAFLVFTFFLFIYFYIEIHKLLGNSAMVFWNMVVVFFAGLLFSSRIEFLALIMAIVFYYCAGLFIEKKQQVAYLKLFEYFSVLLIVFFLAYYLEF